MKEKELPRGVRRRGDSIVVSFALADGTIERRALGTVSVSYAVEQRAIYRRQVREGNYQKRQPRPEKVRPVLVGDLLQPYLRNYRNAGKRAEWRQLAAWNHLKSTFANVTVADLTTDLIEKYIELRRESSMEPDSDAWRARNSTINREVALLRAMLTRGTKVTPRLVKPDELPAFPSKLEESEARQGFIEDSQYRVLAANASVLWLRTLLACAFSFGFRKGELLKLRVRQVNVFDRTINLERRQTKANLARRIFLTDETYQLLAACVSGKRENDYVFTREDGSHVVDPRDDWANLCVVSGFGKWIRATRANGEEFKTYRGLNLHDLRRSAVRRMVRSGISETVAMRISGHSTRRIFDTYDLTGEKDKQEAARKIELMGQVPASTATDAKTDTPAQNPAVIPSHLPRI